MIQRSRLAAAMLVACTQVVHAQDATPIWKMPFEALSNSQERPLFSRTRRPPPQVKRTSDGVGPGGETGQKGPGLDMIGFMIGPDGLAIAVMRETSSQTIKRMRIGDPANGWELVGIERREVTFRQNDSTISVKMLGRLPDKVDNVSGNARPAAQPSGSVPFLPMPAPLPPPCCQ